MLLIYQIMIMIIYDHKSVWIPKIIEEESLI